jgi:hypothetical protein
MRHEAIYRTHKSVLYIKGEIGYDKNDQLVVLDEDVVATEEIRLQAEHDAQEYARNRQAEYPDWGSQLNKIYDDGLTKWKSEMVDPIKAKYPKP